MIGVEYVGVEERDAVFVLLEGGEDKRTDAVGVHGGESGISACSRRLLQIVRHAAALPYFFLLPLRLQGLRVYNSSILILDHDILGLLLDVFLVDLRRFLNHFFPLERFACLVVLLQTAGEAIQQQSFDGRDAGKVVGVFGLDVDLGLLVPAWDGSYFSYISGSFFFMEEFQ